MKPLISHTFSRSEIKKARHDFAEIIKKHFGEVWNISITANYKGCSWDCRNIDDINGGLWALIQRVKHKGAVRAAGKIETKDVGTCLVFTIFYEAADVVVQQ
jgi:hypothetical protein